MRRRGWRVYTQERRRAGGAPIFPFFRRARWLVPRRPPATRAPAHDNGPARAPPTLRLLLPPTLSGASSLFCRSPSCPLLAPTRALGSPHRSPPQPLRRPAPPGQAFAGPHPSNSSSNGVAPTVLLGSPCATLRARPCWADAGLAGYKKDGGRRENVCFVSHTHPSSPPPPPLRQLNASSPSSANFIPRPPLLQHALVHLRHHLPHSGVARVGRPRSRTSLSFCPLSRYRALR